jgi:arylsulfatase A-like enzyme
MRVPFFVVGPGIPERARIDERIYLQDAMATALDLAGQPIPDFVQFKSVMPLIREDRQTQYDALYGGYREHQRAVIDGRYKLILYPKAPKILLFDLENDPEETQNLADEEKYGDVVRRLFEQLLELQSETGDGLKLEATFPELTRDS